LPAAVFFLGACLAGYCLRGLIHLRFRPLERVLQLQMRGDEADDRRGQISVQLLCCPGDSQRRSQRFVLTILELLGDDVDADLVFFEMGDGQQDSALAQVRSTIPYDNNRGSSPILYCDRRERSLCDSDDMLADEETIMWPQVADSCGPVQPESRD
jgi:hypothetical protein